MDGGHMSGFLPEMLRERKVGKLRAAVCTSACPQRLGGLIDLMASGYPVAEYWLPEHLAALIDVGRRFSGDWVGWFRVCGWPVPNVNLPALAPDWRGVPDRFLVKAAPLSWLALVACTGELPPRRHDGYRSMEAVGAALDVLCNRAARRWPGSLSPLVQDALTRLMSGGGPAEVVLLCGRLLFHEAEAMPVKSDTGCRDVALGLSMALMAEALRERERLRWRLFARSGKREDYLVPRHPFRCVNGRETGLLRRQHGPAGPMIVFDTAATLTGPDRGLVYRYGDAHCGALFCGNTRLSFLGQNALNLSRPTVVAAPQRGEVEVDEAYGRIVSSNPSADVWVRSHFSFARKVSTGFREQTQRYCLHGCVHRAVQEILLAFSQGRWRPLAGNRCRC